MKPDELDRVLLREAEIVPSSGFARSVMAAVRSEAGAPPPIPFPWRRALPGIVACGVAIGWSVADAFRGPVRESVPLFPSTLYHWIDGAVSVFNKAQMFGAGWVLLALLLTFAGVTLTWRLAGGRV